ncbi:MULTISPECIES: hypothetical protein [unclassified Afipia]|jgi:hypothetical protein|nr:MULTISPECIES: hypothetical protein [unclassified Afipia]MBQ8103787.1 hypothetical protein [Afipia sp.]MBS4006129.1 hypothetical protein [Afipia sp.]WIG50072.1 MAG: hypothetical protein OJF48_000989 [Afipia sp.]
MAALFTGDDKRSFYAEDDYRAYLISRNPPPIVHHSAAIHWRRLRVHTRRAVNLVDFVLHRMVEALARSKTRRIQRELQLRGIRYPQETHDEQSSPR